MYNKNLEKYDRINNYRDKEYSIHTLQKLFPLTGPTPSIWASCETVMKSFVILFIPFLPNPGAIKKKPTTER